MHRPRQRSRESTIPSPNPALVFLAIGLVSGLLLVFITPPFQAPDEFNHLRRAYHISEGHPIAVVSDQRVGAEMPLSLHWVMIPFYDIPFDDQARVEPGLYRQALEIQLLPEHRSFHDFNNTALMSPLPYLPQAGAIAVGRLARVRPLFLVYAGRLANLLTWLLLVGMAVRVTPVGKWLLVSLALMPMTIFLAASLSYDACTIGISFLATACLLRHTMTREGTVRWRDAAVACLLGAALGLSKFAYAGLMLIWLLIPDTRFRSRRDRVLMTILILAVTTAALIGWGLTARTLFLSYDQYNEDYRIHQALVHGVDPPAQLQQVLEAPHKFLWRYWKTVTEERIQNSFVALLGWLDTPFPGWYIYGYLALLFCLAVADGQLSPGIGLRQRLGLTILILGSLVFFGVLFYCQWSPVGAYRFNGIQGRYFIPLAPLAFLVLHAGNRIRPNRRWMGLTLTLILVASQLYMMVTIIRRYHYWLG